MSTRREARPGLHHLGGVLLLAVVLSVAAWSWAGPIPHHPQLTKEIRIEQPDTPSAEVALRPR
jgi:hypothetical protein